MLEFCHDYCDLNEWCCSQMSQRADWNTFLQCNKEIASYIQKNDLRGFFTLHMEEYKKNIGSYKQMWGRYSHKWSAVVGKYFSYSNSYRIKAYLSLFPLYPRDIDGRLFLLPITDNIDTMLSVVCHELLHFLFFDKCTVYNIENDKTLWLTSELIVPLLFEHLNNQSEMGRELTCSKYCLSEEMISEGRKPFTQFLNSEIEFFQMVKLLKRIVGRFI